MKQKKSKTLFYILILAIVFGVLFVASREVPVTVEHVEQPLENTISNN